MRNKMRNQIKPPLKYASDDFIAYAILVWQKLVKQSLQWRV